MNLMRIDGYLAVRFKKLVPFSIKDYYFNPCMVKIAFKKEMNIDGVIPVEFDRCEIYEDESYIYSHLHGFTPDNVDEEFVDRLFKSLVAMIKNLDPVRTKFSYILEDTSDEYRPTDGMIEYESFEPVRYPYGKKKSDS